LILGVLFSCAARADERFLSRLLAQFCSLIRMKRFSWTFSNPLFYLMH